MKSILFLALEFLLVTATTVSAEPRLPKASLDILPGQHKAQKPIMSEGPDPVLLSDVISIDRSISIFSGFTRAVEPIALRLGDSQQNTTVLAPTNGAIQRLPRKPWESQNDEQEAEESGTAKAALYVGISGEDRAGKNLERFVNAHIVAKSPWEKGEKNKVQTIEGKEVWWDEENGVKKVSHIYNELLLYDRLTSIKIYPDGIEVQEKDNEVTNGQIWVLNGVINY